MKVFRTATTFSLGLMLACPMFAQGANEQARRQTKAELKQQQKADKAQAKADKSEGKALGSKKVKKAAKDQDKANAAQPR